MSDADIAFNVAGLRKEGAMKSKHADALEQFARDKNKAIRKGSEAPRTCSGGFAGGVTPGGISGIPPAIWYAIDCRSSLS